METIVLYLFFTTDNYSHQRILKVGPAKMELTTEVASNDTNETYGYDYYYHYDYDESINDIPLEEFIPVAVVYGLTLLLGVVGNVLVIFSITRYRRMQSVTNIFLVSLSSADLLLVLICVPIKVRIPPFISLREHCLFPREERRNNIFHMSLH